jgi:hypothetical protein
VIIRLYHTLDDDIKFCRGISEQAFRSLAGGFLCNVDRTVEGVVAVDGVHIGYTFAITYDRPKCTKVTI